MVDEYAETVTEFGGELMFAASGLETQPAGTQAVFQIELRGQLYSVTVEPDQKRSALKPSHLCTVCEALWLKLPDNNWTLLSDSAWPCCDNVDMADAPLVPLSQEPHNDQ